MNAILAAISGEALFHLLIYIIVAGFIWWLCSWALGQAGLPEPFNKVARVILAVVAVIWLINLLLSLTGNAFIVW